MKKERTIKGILFAEKLPNKIPSLPVGDKVDYYVMIGVFPDGKITRATFDESGKKTDEFDLFYLTQEETESLKLTKQIYFEMNPSRGLKTTTTSSGVSRWTPAKPLPNGFDIMSEDEYYIMLFVRDAIFRHYHNKVFHRENV